MKEKLQKLLENAYCPYSDFPVSAKVVMKDGQEFDGVNVENANGTSICAERNAINASIAKGYKKGDFKELYVMINSGHIGTPCFACRQVMIEFFTMTDKVICMDKEGSSKVYTIAELCPYPFTSEDLR